VSTAAVMRSCVNLPAQLDSFIAVAEVSHRDVYTVISKHPCGHRAETSARTGDQGDAITQIHGMPPHFARRSSSQGPLPPTAPDQVRRAALHLLQRWVERLRESAMLWNHR